MRVLVCASEAPLPPINGFRLALDALLVRLRTRHDVRVLALRQPDQTGGLATGEELRLLPKPIEVWSRKAARLAGALVRGEPFGAASVAAALRVPLAEELERFRPDVVHVTSGRLGALGRGLAGRPSIIAALDAWHLNVEAEARVTRGPRRVLLRSESSRVKRFEAREYHRFDRVVVVSEQDRAALEELGARLRVEVIPNGVDAERFAPDPSALRDESRIVFTGVMSYAPNVTAAEYLTRRVLPRVHEARPDAHLAIVGREPAPAVRMLERLDGVEVTGEVPDLRPWLNGSRAYACPMQTGTGIKNKLLEAMACALPCVATPLALQGLRVEDGVELLVGATEEEVANHLIRLLADDELARRLGRAARAYVRAKHDWEAVARDYERLYDVVCGEAAR
jgi:glycosyltransferase involved in cell wall biosynthesis